MGAACLLNGLPLRKTGQRTLSSEPRIRLWQKGAIVIVAEDMLRLESLDYADNASHFFSCSCPHAMNADKWGLLAYISAESSCRAALGSERAEASISREQVGKSPHQRDRVSHRVHQDWGSILKL
jgi:hypothetical protein